MLSQWLSAGVLGRRVILLCLSAAVGGGTTALASPYNCSSQPWVQVEAPDERQRDLICEAAGKAIDFLDGHALPVQRKIYIDIVEESIDNHGYIAYGSYDRRTDRINLMSYAAIQTASAAPQMYDEPFDEEHYGGAVAHEVAHAVVQHHFKVEQLSPAPQEYLAHATQLAVLSEKRRMAIIERTDVEPWLPGDTISDVYMALQPTRFAVKSYLHLTTIKDPAAFVTILLNAKWFYVYIPD